MSKVMLITGASRGIGAETARLAAARGYALCLNYRSRADAAEEIRDACAAMGVKAITCQADVADEDQVAAMFTTIDQQLGPITALVNNAGVLETQSDLVDMSVDRWRRVYEVNVLGTFLCSREAVRRMSIHHGGKGGAIVNLSSREHRKVPSTLTS